MFDAQYLRRIADSVNAFLMFDLSHEAGLIAGGVIPNIVGIADVVTMSTDKTLRGPFGGIILCKKNSRSQLIKQYILVHNQVFQFAKLQILHSH